MIGRRPAGRIKKATPITPTIWLCERKEAAMEQTPLLGKVITGRHTAKLNDAQYMELEKSIASRLGLEIAENSSHANGARQFLSRMPMPGFIEPMDAVRAIVRKIVRYCIAKQIRIKRSPFEMAGEMVDYVILDEIVLDEIIRSHPAMTRWHFNQVRGRFAETKTMTEMTTAGHFDIDAINFEVNKILWQFFPSKRELLRKLGFHHPI